MKMLSGLRKQARILHHTLGRLAAATGIGAVRRSTGRSAWSKLRNGEEGVALVEVALTVPVLLGVMTGIVTFGIAYSNQLTLTQAVGSAGQYLAQIRTSTTDPCAAAFTALKNAAPSLKPANISMTITMNGTSTSATSCAGSQTNLVQGTPVSVYATYPCSLAIYGIKFTGSCQLAAKVTEYEY